MVEHKYDIGDDVQYYSDVRAGTCDAEVIGVMVTYRYVVKRIDGDTENIEECDIYD